jgi:hypothetical protein
MSHRAPSVRRPWLLAAALIVTTGGAASVGRTQQVAGAIGVSLTILEPISAPPLRVTRVDLEGDGAARIETMLPASTKTSQLVMVRVSSSTTGFAPEPQPPVRIASSSDVTRVRCRVSVGRNRTTKGGRPTELRVEHLIVAAGT